MAARFPLGEKITGAVPFSLGVTYFMVVVFSVENDCETREGDAFWLLGVPLGFFNLTDKARSHLTPLFLMLLT
jgi:hypothetical protein